MLPELDRATIQRLYAKGLTVDDVDEIPPGHLLLAPVKPPQTTHGGLFVASGASEVPGTAALFYRVLRNGGDYDAGDVVAVRNAMLEPLHPDLEPLLIDARHVLARIKIPLAPPVVADTMPPPFRGVVAT